MPNLTIAKRARVRKDIYDVLLRAYWDSKGEAINAIDSVLQKYHMFLDCADCPGDEGRTVFRILADKSYRALCDSCTDGSEYPAFDNVLSFGWYRMPSGRWEITAYIS